MGNRRRHSGPNIDGPDLENPAALGRFNQRDEPHSEVHIPPFIGRLGGNGTALSRCSSNEEFLKQVPDAAPLMSLSDTLNLRPFLTIGLWKSALMEGVGSLLLVWLTIYANVSPASIPAAPTQRWGVFDNASFMGPLVGGILNFFYLTLFTFCFGAVSGAHLNPTITIATLFARLCSLPRAILYVSFQTGGAALGGLLARASYGTRDFKVGGCWLYPDVVPMREVFTVEFMACTILLFFAFGVGLDPRQKQVVGPTLGPFMVGISLAGISFGTGYTRYGYGGASLNPARCLGSYVGSSFPSFHWIHW
ncbi:aquaporin-like protein [Fusarium austroafricanum]|uniref:Aquaporin-like protein n=1 Tax=Fusarium austroafricanum TaxID=2364996 RepID=A0A8H4NVW4_9HYPO|nr:aquaporin-like protein [Fusarium austroafricanum]